MIPGDLLAKLPDPARAKLQLIADLAADAMADADAALTRLNALARRQGSSDDDPGVVRLSAKYEVQSHRHQQLFSLANAIERWLRSVPPAAELEIAAAPGPPPDVVEEGEMVSAEEAAMRLRAKIGELTVERMGVSQAPEPKADIKRAMRAQAAKLAADAKPTLRAERARAEAVFGDARSASFEASPRWVAGLLCWFDQERMLKLLDAMVDAAIPDDGEAMTGDEQREELAKLDSEIESLQRSEESLICAAFERGTDVLRRSNADPQCVLGVRLVKPAIVARPSRRRERLPGPLAAAMPQAVEASPSGDRVKAAE